jgi:hypothetical protein
MKTTQYLYNVSPKEFAELPYHQALQYKIDKAKELIVTLLEPSYQNRDDERIKAVFDAIKWNQKLLQELKEQE